MNQNQKTAAIQAIVDKLLVTTDADRITLRLDVLGMDYPVVAEAEQEGVPAVAHLLDIPQRDADTVKWIGRNQKILVVADALTNDPRPPADMTAKYGLTAFLLSPLGIQPSGDQVGWISVHTNRGRREWTEADVEATRRATEEVKRLLGDFKPLPSQSLESV